MVKRFTNQFTITDNQLFKQQMLRWANQYCICCLLNSNHYHNQYSIYESVLAVGVASNITIQEDFETALTRFQESTKDWIFGHVSFETATNASSFNNLIPNKDGFGKYYFFQPKTVIIVKDFLVTIASLENVNHSIFSEITQLPVSRYSTKPIVNFTPTISKPAYLSAVNSLKQEISKGNCYEINFCQQFLAKEVQLSAVETFEQLNAISPVPFACFYKNEENFLLSASPERFFQVHENQIISQPIKGTIHRNKTDILADEALKKSLTNSNKDITENVMIVDLVRNDLSKICTRGSVTAPLLFELQPFPQVFHLVSTISGTLATKNMAKVFAALFPMASMTGAPKKKVLELTKQYEVQERGIYSGSVGYIAPSGNADFNVVIRSLIYNQQLQTLSYQVGSGITASSIAEDEYQECINKAAAIVSLFDNAKDGL